VENHFIFSIFFLVARPYCLVSSVALYNYIPDVNYWQNFFEQNKKLKDVEISFPIVYGTISFWLGKKASE